MKICKESDNAKGLPDTVTYLRDNCEQDRSIRGLFRKVAKVIIKQIF